MIYTSYTQLLRLLFCCIHTASQPGSKQAMGGTPQQQPRPSATLANAFVKLTGLAVPVICSSVVAKVARKFWPASKASLKGLTISGIARPGSSASPLPAPSPTAPLSPLISLPVLPSSLVRSSPAPWYPSSPAPARNGDIPGDLARDLVRATTAEEHLCCPCCRRTTPREARRCTDEEEAAPASPPLFWLSVAEEEVEDEEAEGEGCAEEGGAKANACRLLPR